MEIPEFKLFNNILYNAINDFLTISCVISILWKTEKCNLINYVCIELLASFG